MPKDVLAMLERGELEAKANQAHAAMIAATNKRNSLREDVQRLERELQYLPISRDRKEQEARLNAEIERAKAALAASETRLTDAERAHAKARKGL
jgi:chromosome segregation ATPase